MQNTARLSSHSFARAAALAAAAAVSAAVLAGCEQPPPPPPQESWMVVTVPATPLLRKFKDDADAQDVAYAGDLMKVVRETKVMDWTGKMEGAKHKRNSMLLEVRWVDDGNQRFAFLSDLGAQVNIPVTSHICSQIAALGPYDLSRCNTALRRARTVDGHLVVWIACAAPRCPVAVQRDGGWSAVAVDNMTSGSFFVGNKRSMLLASTRWSAHEGKQSGGAFVPVVFPDGTLQIEKEIPTDRVDARDPEKVAARLVNARVSQAEVALAGEEVVKAGDGTSISSVPVDEKHPLPSLD